MNAQHELMIPGFEPIQEMFNTSVPRGTVFEIKDYRCLYSPTSATPTIEMHCHLAILGNNGPAWLREKGLNMEVHIPLSILELPDEDIVKQYMLQALVERARVDLIEAFSCETLDDFHRPTRIF